MSAGDAEHVDRDTRVRRGVPGPGGHGVRAAQVVTSRRQAQTCNVGVVVVSILYLVYRTVMPMVMPTSAVPFKYNLRIYYNTMLNGRLMLNTVSRHERETLVTCPQSS